MILAGFLRGRFNLSGITRRDILLLAASGLAGIVLYFIFENNGLKYTTAASASMIVATVPIFTFFTEALFFKQRISVRPLVCLAVSVVGVYLVVANGGRPDFSSARFLGNMLVVGAMICWVAYTVINKQLTGRYPSLLLTYSQTLFSIPLFLPFVLPEIGRWRMPSTGALLHLFYLGVCCSALGYFFYVYAVKRLGATLCAAFLNLIPVVTTVGGYFILGEKAAPMQLLGMGLIMASLYALSLQGVKTGRAVEGERVAG
ncbi:MAG: DMT family transporter [Bacillota bacterium]